MFRKTNPRIVVCGKVIREVPYWIVEKKVVDDSNTDVSHYFNTIHLHTHTCLYSLNKCIGWR